MNASKGSRSMSRLATRFAALFSLAALAATALPANAFIANGRMASPAERGIGAYRTTARNLRDLGPMNARAVVHIGLLLKYRNEAELESLINAQATKGSRYYHHFLTTAQFAQYFAPDAATYARTIATLQRHGFRVEQTFANRGMIRASAPVRTAASYFATSFHAVYQVGRGVRYVNTTVARMPADLRNDVVALSGLHSITTVAFALKRPDIRKLLARRNALAIAGAFTAPRTATAPVGAPRRRDAAPTPAPGPDATIPPGSQLTEEATYMGYGPDIYAQAYTFPETQGYAGSGHAAGSVIDTDFSDSDAKAEFKTFNIPRTKTGNRVCTDPNADTACCSKGSISAGTCVYSPDTEGESTLDAEAIMTLAPQADFYEYLAPDFSDVGIEAAYNRVVSDDKVAAVNSSFGGCETDDPSFEYATNYIAMQGASLGITFSASSGDTGSTSCGVYLGNGSPQTDVGVSIPAADTYFTGVGGTDFEVLTPLSYYTIENGWTFGGGGVSVIEQTPSYQTGITNVHLDGRNVPDLAFTADPDPPGNGFVITYGGASEATGGTSLSSPMWVATLASMAQEDGLANGFGFVNPGIYAAVNDASYSSYFHDVIVGTDGTAIAGGNVTANGIPIYTCQIGYDNITGAGTPEGFALGAYLK
jgi:subtilase family serine protease